VQRVGANPGAKGKHQGPGKEGQRMSHCKRGRKGIEGALAGARQGFLEENERRSLCCTFAREGEEKGRMIGPKKTLLDLYVADWKKDTNLNSCHAKVENTGGKGEYFNFASKTVENLFSLPVRS